MPYPIVYIVDDDESVRKSLNRLIKSAGFQTEVFSCSEEFLRAKKHRRPACLILDVRMPGLTGIDLQNELKKRSIILPIVFITGHGNIPMSVAAIKEGAVDFLQKPFDDKELLNAIGQAIDRDSMALKEEIEKRRIKHLTSSLTPREHEVLQWVITGMLNKQIAGKLGTTEKTVKVHRGRVMHKMKVVSVAQLVRLTQKCGISPAKKT